MDRDNKPLLRYVTNGKHFKASVHLNYPEDIDDMKCVVSIQEHIFKITLFHMGSKILHIHGEGRAADSISQSVINPRSPNLLLLRNLTCSFQKCKNHYAN